MKITYKALSPAASSGNCALSWGDYVFAYPTKDGHLAFIDMKHVLHGKDNGFSLLGLLSVSPSEKIQGHIKKGKCLVVITTEYLHVFKWRDPGAVPTRMAKKLLYFLPNCVEIVLQENDRCDILVGGAGGIERWKFMGTRDLQSDTPFVEKNVIHMKYMESLSFLLVGTSDSRLLFLDVSFRPMMQMEVSDQWIASIDFDVDTRSFAVSSSRGQVVIGRVDARFRKYRICRGPWESICLENRNIRCRSSTFSMFVTIKSHDLKGVLISCGLPTSRLELHDVVRQVRVWYMDEAQLMPDPKARGLSMIGKDDCCIIEDDQISVVDFESALRSMGGNLESRRVSSTALLESSNNHGSLRLVSERDMDRALMILEFHQSTIPRLIESPLAVRTPLPSISDLQERHVAFNRHFVVFAYQRMVFLYSIHHQTWAVEYIDEEIQEVHIESVTPSRGDEATETDLLCIVKFVGRVTFLLLPSLLELPEMEKTRVYDSLSMSRRSICCVQSGDIYGVACRLGDVISIHLFIRENNRVIYDKSVDASLTTALVNREPIALISFSYDFRQFIFKAHGLKSGDVEQMCIYEAGTKTWSFKETSESSSAYEKWSSREDN